MRKIRSMSMLLVVGVLLAVTTPALAAGDFELRVAESLTSPAAPVPIAGAPRPVVTTPVSVPPSQDMTIFDASGRLEPRGIR